MSEVNDWNTPIIAEFRSSGGKVGMFADATMILLHTTGAKSGKARVNPLVVQELGGGSYAVFASKGGAPTNPDWYHNVVANPQVSYEIGDRKVNATARVAGGEERERIWSKQKLDRPTFAEYEQKTTRQIPVIVLEAAA